MPKGYYALVDGHPRHEARITEIQNNRLVYGKIILEPGVKYSLSIKDDKFLESIKNHRVEITNSVNNEMMIKGFGLEPEYKRCAACGGRIKKLIYNPITVVEE